MDGVLEVSINNAVEGVYRSTAAKWATEAIPNFLVGQVEVDFDYSMYVMPPGADFRGAAAYAAVGGRKSVYNNRNVGTVLVQMHEGKCQKVYHSIASHFVLRNCVFFFLRNSRP